MPATGDLIVYQGRRATACEVLAVDPSGALMWLRPLTGGGHPLTTRVSAQWSVFTPRADFPDMWAVVTATAVSRGYTSRALVLANLPVGALALIHISADTTVAVEWLP